MRLIKESLNKFDDIEFEELKAEVEDLVSNNYFTEALLTISEYYNLKEFIPYLKELSEYQGLKLEQIKERYSVNQKIFNILEKEIGKEKTRELFSCL